MAEIILYQPPGRAWGTPHMSPFCGKLETYLRITETPYRVAAGSMTKAPKGKIPFVAIEGELLGDSQLIIERLERGPRPLDAGLTRQQQALGRAVRRMLEEGAYFSGVYLRWCTDEGFPHVRTELAKILPAPLRLLLPLIRSKVIKMTKAQGTGRHTREEIEALGLADFAACAELLGTQAFLLGDGPHICDCTLYAFLESVLRFPYASALQQGVAGLGNLVAYRDRIRARWWADLG
jgi:glutathione S-transferase